MKWINWDDEWFKLSAQEKIYKYATEATLTYVVAQEDDTFFSVCGNERGSFVPDICEYDFSYITGIEKALRPAVEELIDVSDGFLIRLTAAEMLKKLHAIGDAPHVALDRRESNSDTQIEKSANEPPAFFYPL